MTMSPIVPACQMRLPSFSICGRHATLFWPSGRASVVSWTPTVGDFRVAADALLHLLPIDLGESHETLRAMRKVKKDSAMRWQKSCQPLWTGPSYATATVVNAIWEVGRRRPSGLPRCHQVADRHHALIQQSLTIVTRSTPR
jgi:hypothetical protein